MTEDDQHPAIDVWADIVCPFAHVGLRRMTAARDARSHPARLRIRAWPLELVNGELSPANEVAEKVAALRDGVSPDLFAGFDEETWPATSLPALALTAIAYDRSLDTGEQLALAVRDRLFEDGLDISDHDVLGTIANDHGIEPPSSSEVVLRDYELGRLRGVRGSPHFFVGTEDSFCPTLDIEHEDGLTVRYDAESFDEFTDLAFS